MKVNRRRFSGIAIHSNSFVQWHSRTYGTEEHMAQKNIPNGGIHRQLAHCISCKDMTSDENYHAAGGAGGEAARRDARRAAAPACWGMLGAREDTRTRNHTRHDMGRPPTVAPAPAPAGTYRGRRLSAPHPWVGSLYKASEVPQTWVPPRACRG